MFEPPPDEGLEATWSDRYGIIECNQTVAFPRWASSGQMHLSWQRLDQQIEMVMPCPRKPAGPFRYFNSSPEIIRIAVMIYVRIPLWLRNVEDLLYERGIDIRHETARFWRNRFGPLFAAEIKRPRIPARNYSNWRWHVDEMCVKINGRTHWL